LRRRRNQCAIDASPRRKRHRRRNRIAFGLEVDCLRPELPRESESGAIEIRANYAATLRAKKLNGHQTNEPQADDSEYLAESWLREPNTVKRDCTKRCESCDVVGNRVRDSCA
jgi:hypothetical protein